MAYGIIETQRLLKRTLLSNLAVSDRKYLTPLVSGSHGIGKTSICEQVAKDIGGECITIEASMLQEGDATGLPLVTKDVNGFPEVVFAPHYSFAAVKRLEAEYLRQAKETGFLDGKIRVNEKGEIVITRKTSGKDVVEKIAAASKISKVFEGDLNKNKFGEELPFDLKLELIESGEIQPVIIFIDEINRAENQTMKELMNIVLNKVVNGYKLPWWCFMVAAQNPSSQNSTYATNEMDDAQLDRFIKFVATAKIDEWVDHSLSKNVNSDLILAIAGTEGIFMSKNNSHNDTTLMTPSPRSWSVIAGFMNSMKEINECRFFSEEEKKLVDTDFSEVVYSKVGADAGRAFLAALKNKETLVRPDEIINGKADTIDAEVLRKLQAQKPIQRKITSDNVLKYMTETVCAFEAFKNSNDIEVRAKYTRYMSQAKEYFASLDSPTFMCLIKKAANFEIKAKDNVAIFSHIGKTFSANGLEAIAQFKASKTSLM